MTTLTVPARFCGPPASGNGGWVAGALAALVPGPDSGPVTVSLRRPPPLDVAMAVAVDDGSVAISIDGDPVAVAGAGPSPTPVEPVPAVQAREAEASYAGLTHHPFPTCFSCGTAREPGDGLRIFSGPIGGARTAATWTPGADVDAATTWAAIDCASAWAADIAERAIVLGRMSAVVHTVPAPGVEHVVVGQARSEDGRKIGTAASLYDDRGALVATAEHLWIAVDPAAFGYTGS